MESNSPATIGLDEAYALRTPGDNRRLYAKWAATYESEFVDAKKYRYPKAIAELFNEVVPPTGFERVVDIGTGTGLVGMYLSALRPQTSFDGIDISPEMLVEARQKMRISGIPVYANLYERDLTQMVATTNAPYDALASSGTFTHGHLGPGALSNLIHLVRAGGWFVIGINNEHFAALDFAKEFEDLAQRGFITKPEIRIIEVYEVGSAHHGDQARVAIFRRDYNIGLEVRDGFTAMESKSEHQDCALE